MADLENFDVQEISDRIQEKYEENKNYIFIAIGVIAVIVAGFWWYNSNKESQTLEGNALIWNQENNFASDNFQAAIDGDQNNPGYQAIAQSYDGTSAGEIAAYNMGVGYLNMGKFNEAINALEGVEFNDIVIGAIAKGALGDAYFELREVDNAISSYKAAINHSDNEFTAPVYLKKLAIAQETAEDFADARATYQRIKDDYPNSQEANGVEKFIAAIQGK